MNKNLLFRQACGKSTGPSARRKLTLCSSPPTSSPARYPSSHAQNPPRPQRTNHTHSPHGTHDIHTHAHTCTHMHTQSEGGLDDKVEEIIKEARKHGIPVVFALSRSRLGKALGKSMRMSAAYDLPPHPHPPPHPPTHPPPCPVSVAVSSPPPSFLFPCARGYV